MKHIDPYDVSVLYMQKMLLGAVAPRPIALVSSVNSEGVGNLSPFSFFNAFGVNPVILVFSANRRGRDASVKHTFDNVEAVPQVVVNVVTHAMVEQVNLASSDYPQGVNEFVKSGFTQLKSAKVKPPRVAESPVQFECEVKQVIKTGNGPGAANLVICEVVMMHVDSGIMDDDELIDPVKVDHVGRMGGEWYLRALPDAMFQMAKPRNPPGLGIDALPDFIKYSVHLSGNDLGVLGGITRYPSGDELAKFRRSDEVDLLLLQGENREQLCSAIYGEVRKMLKNHRVEEAFMLLTLAHEVSA